MAEKALKKLEDQLNCPICLDTYTDPKQLHCSHVFCKNCLVKLVFRDQQGQLILTCPNCRQVTPVPANGVAGLQAAFQISKFLEIVEEHKKAEDSAEKVQNASTGPTRHENTLGCTEHAGREIELYCETCEKTICYKCIKKDEKHHSHNYEELDEAIERYKKEITLSLEPMEKQLMATERALAQLDTRCEEISNQQATMEANIHNTFTRLYQTLDVRKTELIGQLHQLTQDKLKSLAVQRDQIGITQAQLSSCLHFMKENLNQGAGLIMNCIAVKKVKELTTTFQPDLLEPNTEADMTFLASVDVNKAIQNYGQVYGKKSPDPSKCIATGKGVEVAAVGKKFTVHLQTLSTENLPSKESLNSITSELVYEMTGTRVGGSVERRGQSQYEISYQPTIKGRHQLHIKVQGYHIRGSPFSVTVRLPVEKLDTPILTISGVRRPKGIAVNQRGDMVVTESNRHCITVFSPSGKRLRSFGTHGSGEGELNNPHGVAIDKYGCILVADHGNHRIQKFTVEGRFLVAAVGRMDRGPSGITCNASNGRAYVTDGSDCVHILNPDLSYAGYFGNEGSGSGQFSCLQDVACDSTGNIYVADSDNHRIHVFTTDGKRLKTFGEYGKAKGELDKPIGLAIDSYNKVYVSEFNNHRVSVFSPEGEFLTSFGGKESGFGWLNGPTGLAVDSCGVVYVCDNINFRIQVL